MTGIERFTLPTLRGPARCHKPGNGARLRHRCDAMLVVLTPDEAVAAWARRPIVFGPGSGHLLPHVIGPAQIPVMTDLDEASRAPELAVLSWLQAAVSATSVHDILRA